MNPQRTRTLICVIFLCAATLLTSHKLKEKHSASIPSDDASKNAATLAALPTAKPLSSAPNAGDDIAVESKTAAAPAWAVSYGAEFWRRDIAEPSSAFKRQKSSVVNPHFDLGDVIDRVDHALETDAGSGNRKIAAANYSALFSGQDLVFSPSRPATLQLAVAADDQKTEPVAAASQPAADPSTSIHFHTLAIERDDARYFVPSENNGSMQSFAMGNTAQALLSPDWGIVTHYEARNDGVAVTWVFSQPLPGTGPIEVSAAMDGLTYAGATASGQHFADANGIARVRVGNATAVDAAGTRWALDTRHDTSGALIVELPASVQTEAVYPLAIDPVIGPEFGMDLPVSSVPSSAQANAAVAYAGTNFLVVWEDSRNSASTGRDIYGARVSTNGTILDPLGLAICVAPADQTTPAIAVNGKTTLVVWTDRRLGSSAIFGTRVAASGAVLDPLGIALNATPSGGANPAVAPCSTNFFVVWDDNRNSGFSGKDIYGARVTAAGIVLDPLGIGISTNLSDQQLPAIATNSAGVFVAWQDSRLSTTNNTDIYGARIDSTGIVLDPNGIALSSALGAQSEPAAAANGDTVLVAWRDRRIGDDVYGTVVNFTNNAVNVFDPNGVVISGANGTQRSPAICALSTNFLVVWRDRRNSGSTGDDIYGARVSINGTVLDAAGFVISNDPNNQTAPAVAGNPSGALVVWNDTRDLGFASDIYGARILNDGSVVDTNGFRVGPVGATETSPVVAFNGTNYLVVWQDNRNFVTNDWDILGTRVSAAGTVLDAHGLQICTLPTAQMKPSVAASGGEFLVAWEDSRNAGTSGVDIYGTRVSGSGAILDTAGIPLSTAANDEATPAVAANASTFLVTWQDNRGGNAPDIFGTLVSQGGTLSNPTGLAISATGGNEINPAVSANSNQFLVTWEDGNDIFAARLTSNGTLLDPSGSAIQLTSFGSGQFPSVAALGTNFLVAWQDDRNFSSDIYAARVFGNGSVPDFDGFPVCTLPTDQLNPAVAANADTWLVVWENKGQGDGVDLYSARVSVAGDVLDFTSTPLFGTADRFTPHLAYGGAGKFLLVSDGLRTNSTRVDANLISADPVTANSFVQFSANSYSAAESSKVAKVTVALSAKFSGEVTVDFTTTDGTATAGVDYMPVSGRIVFTPKKLSQIISIPLIDDLVPEANKTFSITLRNPTGGAQLGARATATVTILE